MNRAFLCPQGGDWCQASGRHSPCVWGRVNSLLPAPVSRASLDALSLLVCSLFSADPEGAGPCGCLSPGPAGQDLSLGPQALVKLLCAGGRLTPSQLPSLPGRPCPPWPLLLGPCPLLSCFAHGDGLTVSNTIHMPGLPSFSPARTLPPTFHLWLVCHTCVL